MSNITTPTTATFDLNEIDAKARYDVWRESIAMIFEVDLLANTTAASFTASLTTCHLSSLLLSTTRSIGQFFNRSQRLIAQDNLDHCLLQVYTHGTTSGQWSKKHNSTVQTGDVLLLDLRQPITSLTSDFTNITLVIPRHILAQHLPNLEKYHGCILPHDSVFGRLLSAHLITLQALTPTLSANEASTIAEGVAYLAGAYFSQVPLSGECHPAQAATGAIIRHYITQHLTDTTLTPDRIAAHFNMSRSYLYRLFDSKQGVSHYIQEQRLHRAFRELQCMRQPQRRISEIAFSLGFSSESHFSRRFQQLFGMSASNVRCHAWEKRQIENNPQILPDRRHEEWLRKL